MTQQTNFVLYKTLDNPTRVFFWSIDEFFVLITPIFASLVFANGWFFFSAFALLPYKKIKKKMKAFPLTHWLYWNIPTPICRQFGVFKMFPSSHLRELIV
jgi:type IV conjugative transfer system protein TraL